MAHLLNAEGITVTFAARALLDGVSLGLDDGDRVGVVGRNGDGKSTLLRVLARRQEPDAGRVTYSGGVVLGMLGQIDDLDPATDVGSAVLGTVPEHVWAADAAVRDVLTGLLGGLDASAVGGLAAPVGELYALVADPRRHHELDGSGTVRDNIKAPAELAVGAKFSTHMKMYGLPYRITSTVTALKPNEVVEWRHPLGHRWRWEFESLSPTLTRVTETFDYSDAGTIKNKLRYYERIGAKKGNAAGIEATLARLRDRYAAR